jgi:hypothetical protein
MGGTDHVQGALHTPLQLRQLQRLAVLLTSYRVYVLAPQLPIVFEQWS